MYYLYVNGYTIFPGCTNIILSAAGAQAVLKYNLRTVPGMSSPIQRQNVPVIRLENKVYESAWQRAARKVKIVTMFRRMGRERERRRRSDDSKLSSEVSVLSISRILCC